MFLFFFLNRGNFPKQIDAHKDIEKMIDFLLSRNLRPYGNGNLLLKHEWLNWPWDIYWKKEGY